MHLPRAQFAVLVHYIEVHQWPLSIPTDVKSTALEALSETQRAAVAEAYDRPCRNTDAAIDQLFRKLDEMGILENTIVVVTSDHGEAIAEYGLIDGHGAGVEESVLRVPLALFGPGIRKSEIATRVSLVDVVPTILGYSGVRAPAELTGRSLRSLVNGAREPDRNFVSEFVLYGGDQSAVYAGRWKYVESAASGESLFDLQTDPAALQNVARAHSDVTERLRRDFRRRQARMLAKLRGERGDPLTLSPDTIESLRSLGYID